jgi:large subunit ribosomal protein L31
MKKDIHPKYYLEAKVTCACGNTWVTGSTQEELKTDVCSKCHPFFTGQLHRLVDRAGQVERFKKRVEQAQVLREEAKVRDAARVERERARALVEVVDEDEMVEPIDGISGEATENQD